MPTKLKVLPADIDVQIPRANSVTLRVALRAADGTPIDVLSPGEVVRMYVKSADSTTSMVIEGASVEVASNPDGNLVDFAISRTQLAFGSAPWPDRVDLGYSVRRQALTGEEYDYVTGTLSLLGTPSEQIGA